MTAGAVAGVSGGAQTIRAAATGRSSTVWVPVVAAELTLQRYRENSPMLKPWGAGGFCANWCPFG